MSGHVRFVHFVLYQLHMLYCIIIGNLISFKLSCEQNPCVQLLFLRSLTKCHAFEKETLKPFVSPLFEIKSNFNSEDKVSWVRSWAVVNKDQIFPSGILYILDTPPENTSLVWPATRCQNTVLFFCASWLMLGERKEFLNCYCDTVNKSISLENLKHGGTVV